MIIYYINDIPGFHCFRANNDHHELIEWLESQNIKVHKFTLQDFREWEDYISDGWLTYFELSVDHLAASVLFVKYIDDISLITRIYKRPSFTQIFIHKCHIMIQEK